MTSHWPIIATIIAVLNAWAIFWLRWYLDKKAKATASPAINELKATKGVRLKRRWFIYLVNFLGTAVSLNTFQFAWNLRPLTGSMIAAVSLATALVVCVQILPWVTPRTVSIPPTPEMLLAFGLRWDDQQNPHCPVDKAPLFIFGHIPESEHGPYDRLKCPSCKQRYPIRSAWLGPMTLYNAKNSIRDHLQRGIIDRL